MFFSKKEFHHFSGWSRIKTGRDLIHVTVLHDAPAATKKPQETTPFNPNLKIKQLPRPLSFPNPSIQSLGEHISRLSKWWDRSRKCRPRRRTGTPQCLLGHHFLFHHCPAGRGRPALKMLNVLYDFKISRGGGSNSEAHSWWHWVLFQFPGWRRMGTAFVSTK